MPGGGPEATPLHHFRASSATHRYTKTDPIGLVESVSAIVSNSRNGLHIGSETDAFAVSVCGTPPDATADVESAHAEGLDMKPRDFDARPEHARKQMQRCMREH